MEILKKYKYHIMAFLIPFIIIFTYFILNNNSFYDLIISDAREQYIYLFDYLKGVFNGENSIFYSFGRGIGGSMYATFYYYLSSPLNIFLMFVSENYIHIFMGLLMFIKIGLCGLTMYMYLSNRNKNDKIINLIFSTSYALMNYNIIYYFQIMWLDIVYLAPLVILGLDNILKNKKSKLYIFSLFLSVVSNYYIAYMLCLFCVLYFIFRLVSKYNLKKDQNIIKQIIKKFIICSLLGGFLASFMIFPVANELNNVYREDYLFGVEILRNPFNIFTQFSLTTINNDTFYLIPYIFFGFFSLCTLVNYFLFSDDKEKKYIIIFIIFLLISFYSTSFIKLWHAFTTPVFFFHRWSFLFSMFMIIIAGEKYEKTKVMTKKHINIVSVIYFLFLLICYQFNNENLDISQIIILIFINIIFFTSNLKIGNFCKKYDTNFYKICLLIICIFENFISLKFQFMTVNTASDLKNNDSLINRYSIKDNLSYLDDNYYRIGGQIIYSLNETLFMENGRIDMFLSINNKNIFNFYSNLGYVVDENQFFDRNSTQNIVNNLLGIRYRYNENNSNLSNKIEIENESYNLFEEENSLNIGYMIKNKNMKINDSNPIENQNSFFKTIYGEPIFKKYVVEKKENIYYLQNNKNDLYIYINNLPCGDEDIYKNNVIKIKLNGEIINDGYCNDMEIFKLESNNVVSEIEIDDSLIENKEYEILFYYMDSIEFNNMINYLKKHQIENVDINKNVLKFDVNVSEDKALMLTIPYEEGWKISVDGKNVNYEKIFDTFIGIYLTDGYHYIEMKYVPKYLNLGILISLIDLILLNLYVNKFLTRK